MTVLGLGTLDVFENEPSSHEITLLVDQVVGESCESILSYAKLTMVYVTLLKDAHSQPTRVEYRSVYQLRYA